MSYFEKEFLRLESLDKEEAISFLEMYISKNKNDIDAQYAYAMYIQRPPFDDIPSSIQILKEIGLNENHQVKAAVLLSYFEFIHYGEISISSLNDINHSLKFHKDQSYYNQLLIIKALYYYDKDAIEFVKYLNKSIENDADAVYNHLLLARLTRQKSLFQKAIANVQLVYDASQLEQFNPIDIDEYINENIRKIHMTEINYNSLLSEYASLD